MVGPLKTTPPPRAHVAQQLRSFSKPSPSQAKGLRSLFPGFPFSVISIGPCQVVKGSGVVSLTQMPSGFPWGKKTQRTLPEKKVEITGAESTGCNWKGPGRLRRPGLAVFRCSDPWLKAENLRVFNNGENKNKTRTRNQPKTTQKNKKPHETNQNLRNRIKPTLNTKEKPSGTGCFGKEMPPEAWVLRRKPEYPKTATSISRPMRGPI